MHNSKLLRSLRQCSGRELSRFGAFLASPYFNKHPSNIAFFEWLRKFAPSFSQPELEVEHLLQHWPLDEPVDRKQLGYLVSRLNGLLEQFLALEQLTAEEPFTFFRLLRQKAAALDIEHLKKRADQKLQQWLEEHSFRDYHYYHQLYQFRLDAYQDTDPYDRSFNPRLQEVSDTLDTYYAISRLRFAWQMRHLEAVSGERYDHHFLEHLLEWLEGHLPGQAPAVLVYRLGLKMLAQPGQVSHYFAFKAGLQQHGQLFPAEERKLLYTGLLNYCIRRGNQEGDTVFLEEYLRVNDLLMQEGLLLEKGQISPWRYVNLKMAALRVRRDDWAWAFIHDYQQHLPEEYRDNVFRYALAYLHFHRKHYDEAQQLLAQVQFEDLLFNVALRTLLVRVYFEAGHIESLLIPQLEANRLFLLRHRAELSARLYEQWRHFNRICAQLAKMDPLSRPDWPALRRQVEQEPLLLHKDWLLEVITSMEVG